jgi:hypothetical protein
MDQQKGFQTQYSLGNDQYPKTILTTVDALSTLRLDPKFYEKEISATAGGNHKDRALYPDMLQMW